MGGATSATYIKLGAHPTTMSASAYFPHEQVREGQDELIQLISRAITARKPAILHAPTGLGKTAAALSAALEHAMRDDLTIIFVTPRHTQHKIVLDTIWQITRRHAIKLPVADIIGKKWFCLQPAVSKLRSKQFAEYCKAMREDKACEYYEHLRKDEQLSPDLRIALAELEGSGPASSEEIIRVSREHRLCPYEVGLLLAKRARIIVTDYFYLFNPTIRKSFLNKLAKEPEKIVLIVDEAHNLPSRVKDLATESISTRSIMRAINEARKHEQEEIELHLVKLGAALERLAQDVEDERYIGREQFIEEVERIAPYTALVEELTTLGDRIREEQQQSSIGAVALFLSAWRGGDEGYARILHLHTHGAERIIRLTYRCLDPAIITRETINACASTILMSGTLTPTSMYVNILGAEDAIEGSFTSPFPNKNRLNLIIPKTSTRFSTRSEAQYREIAKIVNEVIDAVPGNVAAFLPSYQLLNEIYRHLASASSKTLFVERTQMSKQERLEMLERFKGYRQAGAALLGVITGSFGEGIDLPGDLLRGVVIVGLPLQRPDLETKALIEYYNEKFSKGWEYGYVIPAFNRALQSAGRCIRSEKDRGVIIFCDERYAWQNYAKYFPPDWEIKTTLLYAKRIAEFFENDPKPPTTLDAFS